MSMEAKPVATSDEIVGTFLSIPPRDRFAHNWRTAPSRAEAQQWDIPGTQTYINGVILTIDHDWEMGYLIEIVDRDTGSIGFHVIVTFNGPAWHGGYKHDSQTYQPACGTFFNRTDAAETYTVATWALSRIYGMLEAGS